MVPLVRASSRQARIQTAARGSRFDGALAAAAAPLGLAVVYLLGLLAAAVVVRRRPARHEPGGVTSFLVLVPAHDEEGTVGTALASLNDLEYPKEGYKVIVVADNCSDATADVAARAGALVYERRDLAQRGKGYALAWALERALRDHPEAQAVAVLDADCVASPNLLAAFDRRLQEGAAAVQTDYVVGNPLASRSSALRYAAFAATGTVRLLGKSALGLSAGLLGTGMAFRRETLERHPWESFSVTEDAEQHMRLVAAGERVAFAPEASVTTPMPTSFDGTFDQQLRWESGRLELVRSWTPRLAADGLARRDPIRLHAALEPLVPPQSLLTAANAGLALAAAALRARQARRIATASLAGQAAFVLGSLAVVRAPAAAYRALLAAPALVAMKLWIYVRVLARKGPATWTRTARET